MRHLTSRCSARTVPAISKSIDIFTYVYTRMNSPKYIGGNRVMQKAMEAQRENGQNFQEKCNVMNSIPERTWELSITSPKALCGILTEAKPVLSGLQTAWNEISANLIELFWSHSGGPVLWAPIHHDDNSREENLPPRVQDTVERKKEKEKKI